MITFKEKHMVSYADIVAKEKFLKADGLKLYTGGFKANTVDLAYGSEIASITIKLPRALIESMMDTEGEEAVLRLIEGQEDNEDVEEEEEEQQAQQSPEEEEEDEEAGKETRKGSKVKLGKSSRRRLNKNK